MARLQHKGNIIVSKIRADRKRAKSANADPANEVLSFMPDPASYQDPWYIRLEVFRDVFPWVMDSIKEIAGLPAGADIGGGCSTEDNLQYLRAHSEYMRGSRSEDERVVSLHQRQNREWTELTKLPPLGIPRDWRTAGIAANAPQAAIESLDLPELAEYIKSWACALRAKQSHQGEDKRAGAGEIPAQHRTRKLTKKDAIRYMGDRVPAIYRNSKKGSLRWLNEGIESTDPEIRIRYVAAVDKRVGGYYHVDDFPPAAHHLIR